MLPPPPSSVVCTMGSPAFLEKPRGVPSRPGCGGTLRGPICLPWVGVLPLAGVVAPCKRRQSWIPAEHRGMVGLGARTSGASGTRVALVFGGRAIIFSKTLPSAVGRGSVWAIPSSSLISPLTTALPAECCFIKPRVIADIQKNPRTCTANRGRASGEGPVEWGQATHPRLRGRAGCCHGAGGRGRRQQGSQIPPQVRRLYSGRRSRSPCRPWVCGREARASDPCELCLLLLSLTPTCLVSLTY